MAGLLGFVAGFGQGALGAIAETKKQDAAAQRQANLARLQAQYKKEAEYEQARRIADLATSEDPRDVATARLMGWKPAEIAEPNVKTFVDPTNLDAGIRQIDVSTPQGRLQADELNKSGYKLINTPSLSQLRGSQEDGEDLIEFTDEYTKRKYFLDPDRGKAWEFSGGEFKEVDADTYMDVFGQRAPSTITEARAEPAPAPPPMLARTTQAQPQEDSQAAAGQMDTSPIIPKETKSQVEELLGYELADDTALFDYSSAIAGPFDRSIGFVSRFNVVGDIIDALGAEDMAGASRRAVNASRFLQRYMAQAYAYNAEGRKNIQDINIGKELLSGTGSGLSGWFMRDKTAYEGLLQVRDFLITDVQQAYRKSQSRTLPASARTEADNFLANAAPVLPLLNAYIGGYLVSNTGATPPGSRERKPITEWTPTEITAITRLSSQEKSERYTQDQMNAISIWTAELQRRLR